MFYFLYNVRHGKSYLFLNKDAYFFSIYSINYETDNVENIICRKEYSI